MEDMLSNEHGQSLGMSDDLCWTGFCAMCEIFWPVLIKKKQKTIVNKIISQWFKTKIYSIENENFYVVKEAAQNYLLAVLYSNTVKVMC